MTPEDKVREIYRQAIKFHQEWHNALPKQAILDILDALNIKIPGVNVNE